MQASTVEGFSVVADEIRKLAEQTSQSSIHVKDLISAIQMEAAHSMESMQTSYSELSKGFEMFAQTEQSFKEVKEFTQEITDQLQTFLESALNIAKYSERVVSDVKSVGDISNSSKMMIENVSAATQEQLSSMEEIASTAQALEKVVEELNHEVEMFKLS